MVAVHCLLSVECDVMMTVSGSHRELDYDDVYNQAGPTNCTVYCGGIQTGLTGKQLPTMPPVYTGDASVHCCHQCTLVTLVCTVATSVHW